MIEKAVTQLCLRPRANANGEQTTFGVFFKRWVSGELHKLFPDYVPLKTSAKADKARYKKWIEPHLKEIPLSMISDADAERVMAALPERLSPASRRHVAQIMGRTLNLAVYPARLISRSPIPKGFLPKARAQKHFQFLYPKEEALLLAHKKVDIAFRLFVGILDREGMRVSELLESEWWQWNLNEGVFRKPYEDERPENLVASPGRRARHAYLATHAQAVQSIRFSGEHISEEDSSRGATSIRAATLGREACRAIRWR